MRSPYFVVFQHETLMWHCSNLDGYERCLAFHDVPQVAVMRMCDHPNVLSCYASFVHENELWLVMEFMSKGSCLHVMNVAKKEVS